MSRRADSLLILCLLGLLSGTPAVTAQAVQEPAAPLAVSPEQLKAAIDKLGDAVKEVMEKACPEPPYRERLGLQVK